MTEQEAELRSRTAGERRKMGCKKVCQTEAKNFFQNTFDGISSLLIFSGNYYLQKT
jgi:hypothetical protein